MITILLTEFLKNIFGLLESRSIDVEKTDEKLIMFCLDFVSKLLKNTKSFLSKVNVNKDLLDSMLLNLLVINREVSNLIAHLEMEINKSTKGKTICERRNVPVTPGLVNKSYTASDLENNNKLKIKLDNPSTSSKNNDTSEVGASSNIPQHKSDFNPTSELSHGETGDFSLNKLLAGEYEGYQLYNITVKQFKSLNELQVTANTPNIQTLSVLELKNLVIINGTFSIKKMAWHGIVQFDEVAYKCLFCSVCMESLQAMFMTHIQSPAHKWKVAHSMIWFPEMEFCGVFRQYNPNLKDVSVQCMNCLIEYPSRSMSNHIQSPLHKESYRVSATVNNAVIRKTEELLAITEIDQNMVFFAEILYQNKMSTNYNLMSCNLCNSSNMPRGIMNLFSHIWGQKHRKLHNNSLKEKLSKTSYENVRGFFQVFYTNNVTFCAICNITLEGTSSQTMNEHVRSFCHNTFLVLYLRAEKIKLFLEFSNENKSSELKNKQKIPTIAINELPENENKRSRFFDIGTHVAINFDITIEKHSWNVVSEQENAAGELQYWCAPCNNLIRMNKLEAHLATPHHQSNLALWPLILENGIHFMRKSQSGEKLFCLICNDFLTNSDMKHHIKSIIHTSRFSTVMQHCEGVKAAYNKAYVERLYQDLCGQEQTGLIEMLEQKQLTILSIKRGDISRYEAFCRPCVECFEVPTFSDIYRHFYKHERPS